MVSSELYSYGDSALDDFLTAAGWNTYSKTIYFSTGIPFGSKSHQYLHVNIHLYSKPSFFFLSWFWIFPDELNNVNIVFTITQCWSSRPISFITTRLLFICFQSYKCNASSIADAQTGLKKLEIVVSCVQNNGSVDELSFSNCK